MLKDDWFRYASDVLKFPTEYPTQLNEMLQKLRNFYILENKSNSSNPLLDLISDRYNSVPINNNMDLKKVGLNN